MWHWVKSLSQIKKNRLLLRTFLGQYDASRRPDDRVSHKCHSAHCVVLCWCRLSDPGRLSAESHTLHRRTLLVRTKSCWKTRGTVRHTVRVLSYQYSTWYLSVCASGLCVGVCRAMALISNARPSHEQGKGSLVETGLIGPDRRLRPCLVTCIC